MPKKKCKPGVPSKPKPKPNPLKWDSFHLNKSQKQNNNKDPLSSIPTLNNNNYYDKPWTMPKAEMNNYYMNKNIYNQKNKHPNYLYNPIADFTKYKKHKDLFPCINKCGLSKNCNSSMYGKKKYPNCIQKCHENCIEKYVKKRN